MIKAKDFEKELIIFTKIKNNSEFYDNGEYNIFFSEEDHLSLYIVFDPDSFDDCDEKKPNPNPNLIETTMTFELREDPHIKNPFMGEDEYGIYEPDCEMTAIYTIDKTINKIVGFECTNIYRYDLSNIPGSKTYKSKTALGMFNYVKRWMKNFTPWTIEDFYKKLKILNLKEL